MDYKFPDGFIWGTATSAYQVEGAYCEDGKGESIWDRFSRIPGKIKNGDTADIACDHYHLYRNDVQMMKELGVKSYRLSVSWPRIFPEGNGRVNQKGIDFYKRLFDCLGEAGIDPNVTLYHWDMPQKLQDRGGLVNRDFVNYFNDYACTLFEQFPHVPLWSTFNEPHVVHYGYLSDSFAPGVNDAKAAAQAAYNLLLSHGTAVRSFRAIASEASKIGIAIDIWQCHPARDCQEDRTMAADKEEWDFHIFLHPLFKGAFSPRLIELMKTDGILPDIRSDDMEVISSPIDFLGLNIYSRNVVSADSSYNIETRIANAPDDFTDFKYEIYPQCIYDVTHMVKNKYRDIPMYITENGCAYADYPKIEDNLRDAKRVRYINGYLSRLHKAIADGADVRGYYYWSLMDNFEWTSGYDVRCGLAYVDYRTQKRVWKDSARRYMEIIRNNGL